MIKICRNLYFSTDYFQNSVAQNTTLVRKLSFLKVSLSNQYNFVQLKTVYVFKLYYFGKYYFGSRLNLHHGWLVRPQLELQWAVLTNSIFG